MKKLLMLPIFLGSLALVGCQSNSNVPGIQSSFKDNINAGTAVKENDLIDNAIQTESSNAANTALSQGNLLESDPGNNNPINDYLKNINPEAYRNMGYRIDGNQVYYFTLLVTGANPDTFILANEFVAYDDKGIYFKGERVYNNDGSKIEVISSFNIDLGVACYYHNGNLIFYNDVVLDGADLASFYVEESSRELLLAKDKDSVYVEGIRISDNVPELKVLRHSDAIYFLTSQNVWFYNQKIDGADPESFSVFDKDPLYAKDLSSVYRQGRVIQGADAGSFSVSSFCIAQDNFASYTCGNRSEK